MSSLLSKLKTLISAGTRGSRQHKRESTPPDETEPQEAPVPEVTEAHAHQRDLPPVTEAPLAEPTARPAESIQVSSRSDSTAVRRSAKPVKDADTGKDQSEALEEERVVDLLKGKSS